MLWQNSDRVYRSRMSAVEIIREIASLPESELDEVLEFCHQQQQTALDRKAKLALMQERYQVAADAMQKLESTMSAESAPASAQRTETGSMNFQEAKRHVFTTYRDVLEKLAQ